MASSWTGFRRCTCPETPRPTLQRGRYHRRSSQAKNRSAIGRMPGDHLVPGLGQRGRRCHDRWSRRTAVIMEQKGLPGRTQTPFDISGQHARPNTGASAIGPMLIDRPDLPIHSFRLQTAGSTRARCLSDCTVSSAFMTISGRHDMDAVRGCFGMMFLTS